MTGWGGPSVALGDDDTRGAISGVGRRELGEDGQDDVGRERPLGISVPPLGHLLERLLLELPRLFLHRQLGLQTRAPQQVRVQPPVKPRVQTGIFALLEFGLEELELPLHRVHDHLPPQSVVHVPAVQPGREGPAVSAPRPPSALAADVAAEAHVASLGAEPQPGLPEAPPGWGEMAQKVFSPLAFAHHLGAAQGPVLVVDGVFDGEWVFVREESDAGLGLGRVVEHAAVGDALTVRGDGPRGKI